MFKVTMIIEILKMGVVTIDVLSIGIKFENCMQTAAGIKVCTMGATSAAKSPLFCLNWYSFLGHF